MARPVNPWGVERVGTCTDGDNVLDKAVKLSNGIPAKELNRDEALE